jgi:hypothetical protein
MSNFVNLMDIIYPVGSIYQSMNATSPADSVGGTWTQLKTFLYGSDAANNTGGEATHTLTTYEIPAHRHIMNEMNGSGALSGWAFATHNGKYMHSSGFCANEGGGTSTQQLAALHNLLHLVQDSVTTLKANCLNLSEVAYV